MRVPVILAAALVASACTEEFSSESLKMTFQPPRGASLVEEKPGPDAEARFSNGLEIHAIEKAPPAIDADRLDELLQQISTDSGIALTGDIVSSRSGQRSTGPAARWLLRDGETRTIVYYVVAKDRYLVFVQRAWEAQHHEATDQLELAMGSLRLLD